MKQFKFLREDKDWDRIAPFPIPLEPNEQMIRYWDDGGNRDMLYEKFIAWSTQEHRRDPRWLFTRFIGTMQEFFIGRTDIPVIKYFEREGSLLYMGEDYPIVADLEGTYEIYYYETV